MRIMAVLVALGTFAGCDHEPSIAIVAPLPDTSVVAAVELRLEGHDLAETTETKVYLDLQQYSDLITNTLPDECGTCNFVISFAGASIPNGPHNIAVYMYEGEEQVASDSVDLVFAR